MVIIIEHLPSGMPLRALYGFLYAYVFFIFIYLIFRFLTSYTNILIDH